jgi:hypothetical protein
MHTYADVCCILIGVVARCRSVWRGKAKAVTVRKGRETGQKKKEEKIRGEKKNRLMISAAPELWKSERDRERERERERG